MSVRRAVSPRVSLEVAHQLDKLAAARGVGRAKVAAEIVARELPAFLEERLRRDLAPVLDALVNKESAPEIAPRGALNSSPAPTGALDCSSIPRVADGAPSEAAHGPAKS